MPAPSPTSSRCGARARSPTGLHSVKIVRSASSATGKYLTLDAVDIYGTIAAPPTRYEQTNAASTRPGVWTDYSNATASGSSYRRSLTADASATIHFTGTRIDYIGIQGHHHRLGGGVAGRRLSQGHHRPGWPPPPPAASSSGRAVPGSKACTPWCSRGAGPVWTEYLTLDAVDIWGAIQ